MSVPLRVLLLHGPSENGEFVLDELKRGGYAPRPTHASSASDLRHALGSQPWEIVIADDSVPDCSGVTAHGLIKELGLDVPLILLSKPGAEHLAIDAIKAGIHDCLTRDQLPRLLPACERAIADAKLRHERRRTEQALRESEERFRTIVDHAADGIMIADERGLIESYNPSAARIFGYNASEIIGQNIRVLIPRPYLREHESYRPTADAQTSSVLSLGREVIGHHKDGYNFPIELSVSETFTGSKRLCTAIVRDMTERRRAEEEIRNSHEQLRSLAARLQFIREEERTHISREIHDELGQSLTGVKMDLAWLQSKLPAERPDLHERLQSTSRLIDDTIQTVRKIAAELRPGILDNLGLVAAIEWQASEFQSRTGIRCHCSARLEDQNLDPERCTALFRIFQETLTNIMRHAKASAVDVSIEQKEAAILLQVHDNGRGITAAQSAGAKSLGLLGMRERALLFGGEFSITGLPDQGTTVTVYIPLA